MTPRPKLLALLPMLLLPSLALANWTATGRFVYVDREFDQNGFTGNEPSVPIRFADVDILDSKNKVLASGATDLNGNFSIFVVDSSNRTVYDRVTTRSTKTSGLFVDVQSNSSGSIKYYAVRSVNFSNHGPNVNLNFGTVVAAIGQGGEAFNIFDQLVRGTDYIAFLRGSRPGSADDLSAVWAFNRGEVDSNYNRATRLLSLRDTAGYDDTVILHEMGHYFMTEYAGYENVVGSHTFSNCAEDIRLAYDEGYPTYWGNSVFRFLNLPRSNIYTRTDGAPGPGHLVRYADLETDTQYLCQGDTSEMNVATVLWDINDSASTNDTTPGVDDAHDLLALPDSQVWEVERDYVATALNKSLEDFWDGWFKAPISNGNLSAMRAIFGYTSVNFLEDASEANNSAATARPITVGGGSIPLTLFSDPDGDGAGQADTDYFVFSATSGQSYRAETSGLLSDGNTLLELLDSDGSTVLASNNDRAAGDDSSLVTWTAPRSDAFYLRVSHYPDFGIYGSYQLSIAAQ